MNGASDYVRDVVDYFLARRGHGTSVSAIDQHVVERWEEAGVPIDTVYAGIDRTFAKRIEAPRTLAECARFVKWAQLRSADDEASESGAEAAAEPDVIDELRELAGEAATPLATAVYRALADELESIAREEGGIDAATIALLDEAIVAEAIAGLSEEERTAVTTAAHVVERARGGGAEPSVEAYLAVLESRYGLVSVA